VIGVLPDVREHRRCEDRDVHRVLIVDDHAAFRSMARALLESEGVEIVGESEDGDGAVVASATLRPGVVLVDIHLPGDDGFAVARRLAALPHPPAVVMISSRPAGDLRRRLAAAAVAGFIPKDELSLAAIDDILGDTGPPAG
jgi:DNA-binding NarL/FixJ family response regulator